MTDDPHRFRFQLPAEVEVMEPEASPALLEADAKAVLMRAVCGDPTITSKQMRAAIALLPFLYPKIAVSSAGPNKDFAKHLERARYRSAALVVDNTQGDPQHTIEDDIDPLPTEEDAPDDAA